MWGRVVEQSTPRGRRGGRSKQQSTGRTESRGVTGRRAVGKLFLKVKRRLQQSLWARYVRRAPCAVPAPLSRAPPPPAQVAAGVLAPFSSTTLELLFSPHTSGTHSETFRLSFSQDVPPVRRRGRQADRHRP